MYLIFLTYCTFKTSDQFIKSDALLFKLPPILLPHHTWTVMECNWVHLLKYSIFWYFALPLHYILEANIVVSTPLHLFDKFKLLVTLQITCCIRVYVYVYCTFDTWVHLMSDTQRPLKCYSYDWLPPIQVIFLLTLSSDTVSTLKSRLKTHLFRVAYSVSD